MSRRPLLLFGLVSVLGGCRSIPTPDGKAAPISSTTDSSDGGAMRSAQRTTDAGNVPRAEEPETPLAWGTRPPKDGILFPIVDGMCIHGEVWPLTNGAIFTYGTTTGAWSRGGETTAVIVGDRGMEPQIGTGFGKSFGWSGITSLAGTYPDHLWAILDVSSRMVTASEISIGDAKGEAWKVVVESGAKFGDAGNAAEVGKPLRNFGKPLPLQDGSTLIPEEISVRQNTGEDKTNFAFRLIDRNGALVATAKMPGPDLAKLAMADRSWSPAPGIIALANGEILGVRTEGAPKLVRWSPSKPVDDLPLPLTVAKSKGAILAGRTHAFVQLDGKLFAYDGEKIEPAKVSPRLTAGYTFAVGADDTLYVALPSKTLLIETTSGAISEETMPAFGVLYANKTSSEVWMLSEKSTQLHRRGAKGWEPVPIPAPPFGNALRGPLTIEGIKIVGPGDVFVNTRRIEKGWSWSKPEPYRAIYRTKRPTEVLRCQDVRNESTGVGVHSWPPAAGDTCTTPFVVVMREDVKVPPKSYPSIAAKLRGKTELGSTLTFVSFEGRGTMNLGIPMNDTATAQKLATHISKSLDYRADVSCGRPTPTRELELDVATGSFR
jgi:hypothetical protein